MSVHGRCLIKSTHQYSAEATSIILVTSKQGSQGDEAQVHALTNEDATLMNAGGIIIGDPDVFSIGSGCYIFVCQTM